MRVDGGAYWILENRNVLVFSMKLLFHFIVPACVPNYCTDGWMHSRVHKYFSKQKERMAKDNERMVLQDEYTRPSHPPIHSASYFTSVHPRSLQFISYTIPACTPRPPAAFVLPISYYLPSSHTAVVPCYTVREWSLSFEQPPGETSTVEYLRCMTFSMFVWI